MPKGNEKYFEPSGEVEREFITRACTYHGGNHEWQFLDVTPSYVRFVCPCGMIKSELIKYQSHYDGNNIKLC